MTDRKLMQQALEALTVYDGVNGESKRKRVLIALRERLAQPEQEPVAWRWKERINGDFYSWVISAFEPPPYAIEKQPLYTVPPQRQPLTNEEADELVRRFARYELLRATEAAHGIKGEA